MTSSIVPGSRLRRGATAAGTTLEELIVRGERVHCWRARRHDGSQGTVHALADDASEREADNFLGAARRLAAVTGTQPIPHVVEVAAVSPSERLYVARGGAAGTMEDLPILGWGVRDTVAFIRRLSRGLRDLHRHGVVHGALRPANVLLDDDLDPKVSDAGCIVIDDSYPGQPSDAEHDYSTYAAREVRLGEAATRQSDVYSLGRLVYFALVGEHPKQVDEDVPLLAQLSDQPPGLVRIVRRATLRDPSRRYASVDAFLKDIERYDEVDGVGVDHPEGLEDGDRVSAPPSWHGQGRSDSDRPGRSSVNPGDLGRVTPTAARREAPTPRERPSPVGPDPAEPRRGAATPREREVAPPPQMKPYHSAPPPDDDDPLTPGQARLGAAFGALVLLSSLGLVYSSAVASTLATVGVIVGAAGVSLVLPPVGPPVVARLAFAATFAALAWLLHPATAVAVASRRARLESGSPVGRGQRLVQLRARGIRDFSDIDLGAADFTGLDLSGVVLDGASLRAARLERASVAGASMRGTDLTAADLSGADLTGIEPAKVKGWRQARCDADTKLPRGWVCEGDHPEPADPLAE